MCSIVIVGAIVTMTGCPPQQKSGTAERTVTTAEVLTKWTPVIRQHRAIPRGPIYVERIVAAPQAPSQMIYVEVPSGPCPPHSYACQVLPTQVQLVGRPGSLPRLSTPPRPVAEPGRLQQPATKPAQPGPKAGIRGGK